MKQTFVLTISTVLLAAIVPLGLLITAQVRSGSAGSGGRESDNDNESGQQAEIQAGDYRLPVPTLTKTSPSF